MTDLALLEVMRLAIAVRVDMENVCSSKLCLHLVTMVFPCHLMFTDKEDLVLR